MRKGCQEGNESRWAPGLEAGGQKEGRQSIRTVSWSVDACRRVLCVRKQVTGESAIHGPTSA